MLPQSELPQILKETISVVEEGVRFISSESTKSQEVEEKSRNSLVTYVDKETEKLLIERLRKILPEAGIIGEEGVGNISDKELNWIIDPLDGTTNFIHRIPCYSISVALAHKSDLLVGVVHEVNLNECFSAYKGGGAFLNGDKISTSNNRNLKDSLLATGFPYYDYGNMKAYLNLLNDFMESTRGLRRLGSAAVDLAYVACGRFDAFYEYSLSPWDVAAGALLVQEAGGVVTDFSGGSNFLFGKEISASSLHLQKDVLSKIKKHFYAE